MSEMKCRQCGLVIEPDQPCPHCLLEMALAGTGADTGGAIETDAVDIAAIREAFPHLEILEQIGRGGMGTVFKARQPRLDRFVALKILSSQLAARETFADRFAQEGKLLAKLNHPNIVSVYDYGEANGLFYLLLEYVDGVNLRQAMRGERFTPEQAIGIVPKICDALQYAHDEGVLHRDIKPENILLDVKGRVKIADFGIAGVARPHKTSVERTGIDERSEHLTPTGTVLGTPHYMAPEQWETPDHVDHRADIYSLGVVFYELLTGELPRGVFPPPSVTTPVTPAIDGIVMKALQKNREERQQTAVEMKTEIETAAGLDALPESHCKKNRDNVGATGATGLINVLLILGLLFNVEWLTCAIGLPNTFALSLFDSVGLFLLFAMLGAFIVACGYTKLVYQGFVPNRHQRTSEEMRQTGECFWTLAKITPLIGIVLTLVGYCNMLARLDSSLFLAGIQVTFLTILYGGLVSLVLFVPIAVTAFRQHGIETGSLQPLRFVSRQHCYRLLVLGWLIAAILLLTSAVLSGNPIAIFWDVPSAIIVAGCLVLYVSFRQSWVLLFRGLRFQDETREQASQLFFKLTRISLGAGCLGTLIGVYQMGVVGYDLEKIGVAMAMSILTPLYGILLAVFVLTPLSVLSTRRRTITKTSTTHNESAHQEPPQQQKGHTMTLPPANNNTPRPRSRLVWWGLVLLIVIALGVYVNTNTPGAAAIANALNSPSQMSVRFGMPGHVEMIILVGIVIAITLIVRRALSPNTATSPLPTKFCTHCGAEQIEGAYACKSCGFANRVKRAYCFHCGAKTDPEQILCVACGTSLGSLLWATVPIIGGGKDRTVTAILALMSGWFGIHKFYLGSWGWGIVYLVFSPTAIPLIASIIEGISFLNMDDSAFDRRYNQTQPRAFRW